MQPIGTWRRVLSAQTVWDISQLLLVTAAIFTAVGTAGNVYSSKQLQAEAAAQALQQFKEIRDKQDEAKDTAQQHHNVLNSKLDKLISSTQLSPEEERVKTAELQTEAEDRHVKLQEEFPFGYALLSIGSKDWFALPRLKQGSFDWSVTKIVYFDAYRVVIRLPDYQDSRITMTNNSFDIRRVAGETSFPYYVNGMEFGGRVLRNDAQSLLIAVGARRAKL